MPRCILALLLPAGLLLAARPAHAAEGTQACTGFVTSLPAAAYSPRVLCLQSDLNSAPGDTYAIQVNSDDVTIDCNGHRLSGAAGGMATNAIGIYAVDRRNITIRHCDLRGYVAGVALIGAASSGHLVEDNIFVGNTYEGIDIEGTGSTLRRNRIFRTGGTTTVGPSSAIAIMAVGTVDVLDNTIADVHPADDTGSGFGLYVMNNQGGTIARNRIRGPVPGSGDRAGIILGYDNENVVLRDNRLSGTTSTSSFGIECINTTTLARDNIVNGFPMPIAANCIDGGGNDQTN